MTATQLVATCETLRLPRTAAFVASLHRLPEPIAPPALPELVAYLPPPLAAVTRSAAHALDPASCRTMLEALEERVAEQSLAARDLLANYFFDPFTLAWLQRVALTWRPVATTWADPVVRLNDDAFWQQLAGSPASAADLTSRLETFDVAALAALFARGEAKSAMTSALLERWHHWIEILMTAHMPLRASVFAGLLARERGDARALSRWGELQAAQALRFPDLVEARSGISTFGVAAERVAPVDFRGAQYLLRLRLACAMRQPEAIAELLTVDPPRGMSDDLVIDEMFCRLEAAVRLGQPIDTGLLEMGYEVVRQRRSGWLYGRWVVLLALSTLVTDAHVTELEREVESFSREFGCTIELYVELQRYTASPALRDYLYARLLGDVLAHPNAVTPWLALVKSVDSHEAKEAQRELIERRDQQLRVA